MSSFYLAGRSSRFGGSLRSTPTACPQRRTARLPNSCVCGLADARVAGYHAATQCHTLRSSARRGRLLSRAVTGSDWMRRQKHRF